MSSRCSLQPLARQLGGSTLFAVLCLGSLAVARVPALAAEQPQPGVATSAGENGTLVRRKTPGQPWHFVTHGESLPGGELIVGAPGAVLDSANGAVRAEMLTDLDGQSPYPVVECAVVLHDTPKVNLDLTLDRGRLDLTNRKEQGAAHVRVRVRQDTWDLTLEAPGASIALELYGRWARGVPFKRDPGPKDVPNANLVFLVLKGEVALEHDGTLHALTAPPGPAMIAWDNVSGQDDTPDRLEKLPAWARGTDRNSAKNKALQARRDRLRELLLSKGLKPALQEFLDSDDEADRRMAINAMSALDDLQGLARALQQAKHPDVWDNGVIALRRWIGRDPGQDPILYQRLIQVGKFSPVHAETVMQLLHSYGDDDLARPETYQTLLDYLEHDKLAIRGLAYWHLSRLVPAGKKFSYDPLGPKPEREAALRKWRGLIPDGQVPPRPTTVEKRK